MSTVYSLIAWGGRTGKTVSLSATTDVVTLTNHGLRNGTKLWPSGTLPAELNTSTPVYARSTAANTFTLHTSSAGAIANTGQITFAGSSTYAAVVLKSDLVADPSNALAAYGLSDLSRWGSSGSERIYDGISTWHAARLAASADSEVAEIGEAFTSYYAGVFAIAMGSASSELVTKINGIRTSAFHAGKMPVGTYAIDNGFVALGSGGSGGGFNISSANTTLDGFVIENVGGTYAALLSTNNIYLRKVICKGPGSVGNGINFNGAVVSTVDRCVSTGYAIGYRITGFASGLVVTNNLAVGNVKGFSTDGSSVRGWYYNNIAIGNTTNWDTWTPNTSALVCVASNNAGLSGEAWITTGKPRITMATTDFLDYANSDFRPALSSSPQVDTGIPYYGISPFDISGAEAPNYNNGGAEYYDIGAYEYDHGYGNHPDVKTVTISAASGASLSGAEVRIYDLDNSPAGSLGTELDGTESNSGSTFVYDGQAGNSIWIQIINAGYVEFGQQYTIPSVNSDFSAVLTADTNT